MSAPNRAPATIDGESGNLILAPVRTRPIKLDTLRNIRDEIGRVYREARCGKIQTQDATRLVFVLDKLREVVVDMDLETRLHALEGGTK
jgi:hypothetical protein